MNCPNCGKNHGHFSKVTYTPVEGGKTKITEAYWFCHTCATLLFEEDVQFNFVTQPGDKK